MSELTVEVVFALADRQEVVSVVLRSGATVGDAIDESAIADSFPEEDLETMAVGVWGRVVPRNQLLADGDRVEIYRPLFIDPREARRRRAASSDAEVGTKRG